LTLNQWVEGSSPSGVTKIGAINFYKKSGSLKRIALFIRTSSNKY
jgi:hypothetical protein